MTPNIFSFGFLLLRRQPALSFLLMKHPDRWDLPKGHQDDGESGLQCALRELREETGISPTDIQIEPDFAFEQEYTVNLNRYGPIPQQKRLTIYLAWLIADREVKVTEHEGFSWFHWDPPHQIQPQTIDPLLAAVERFLTQSPR